MQSTRPVTDAPARPGAKGSVRATWSEWATSASLAALSGALHVLSLPPFAHGGLALVALVPALVAFRMAAGPRSRLALGAVFGLVSVGGVVHWLPEALEVGNGLGPRAAAIVSLGVVGWHAVWLALWPLAIGWLERGPLRGPLAPPIAWVALEAIRNGTLPAAGWLAYGHSQHEALASMQWAAVVGTHGLSFGLVTIDALLADALRPAGPGVTRSFRLGRAGLAAALVAVAFGGGWGLLAAEDRAVANAGTPPLAVVVVQAAVPQAERWRPEAAWPRVVELLALSERALSGSGVAGGDALVVWPETAIEMHLDAAEGLGAAVASAFAGHPNARLLAGAPREIVDAAGRRYHNSAVLLDARGARTGLYDKRVLFPVSEYVPPGLLALPGARRLFAAPLRWHPYTEGAADQPLLGTGTPTGVLICAEGVSPGPARERVAQGAGLLVQLANDAVIPGPTAAAQHFALVRMRAVETRRPIVRAANLGLGAIVSSTGRIVAIGPPDEPGWIAGHVVPRRGTTLYTRFGDWLPPVCLGLTLLGGWLPARRARPDESERAD